MISLHQTNQGWKTQIWLQRFSLWFVFFEFMRPTGVATYVVIVHSCVLGLLMPVTPNTNTGSVKLLVYDKVLRVKPRILQAVLLRHAPVSAFYTSEGKTWSGDDRVYVQKINILGRLADSTMDFIFFRYSTVRCLADDANQHDFQPWRGGDTYSDQEARLGLATQNVATSTASSLEWSSHFWYALNLYPAWTGMYGAIIGYRCRNTWIFVKMQPTWRFVGTFLLCEGCTYVRTSNFFLVPYK